MCYKHGAKIRPDQLFLFAAKRPQKAKKLAFFGGFGIGSSR